MLAGSYSREVKNTLNRIVVGMGCTVLLILVASSSSTDINLFVSSSFVSKAKGNANGGGNGGGAVPLIPLNSGNPELDHQVDQFFKCIKKTGHTGGPKGEPSKEEVDNCYNIVFVGGTSSDSSTGNNHHRGHAHKDKNVIIV